MMRLIKTVSLTLAIVCLASISFAEIRQQDKKCVECHKKIDAYYNPANHWGSLKSIYIDYDKFMNSKHKIFLCVDCHKDAEAGEKTHFSKVASAKCEFCHIDPKFHSDDIKKLFEEKKIVMKEKNRVYNDYALSAHGKAFYEKKKNAPYCNGCHNPHNANLEASDSPVSRQNLPKTCGKCHFEQTRRSKGVIDRLSLFKINGHKKGDSSVDYTANNCIDCHQGDAVHGKKITEQKCFSCHQGKGGFFFADFHGKEIPALALLINFKLIFGAFLIIGIVLVFRFTRKKDEKKEE